MPATIPSLMQPLVFTAAITVATSLLPADETVPTTRPPRVKAGDDLSDPSSVQGRLSAIRDATNSENLDAFLDCFTAGTRRKIRKPAAILFAQHDVAMELVDWEIVEQSASKTQVAVKYNSIRSGQQYTLFSLVDMRKENGYWRVSGESVRAIDYVPPASCTPSRYSCFGGQCGISR